MIGPPNISRSGPGGKPRPAGRSRAPRVRGTNPTLGPRTSRQESAGKCWSKTPEDQRARGRPSGPARECRVRRLAGIRPRKPGRPSAGRKEGVMTRLGVAGGEGLSSASPRPGAHLRRAPGGPSPRKVRTRSGPATWRRPHQRRRERPRSRTGTRSAAGWAVGLNSPSCWMKQVPSDFGGTRNGMVVSWPKGIKARELYDVRADFSLATDLAAQNPTKLAEMQALFLSEAAKYGVLPIDDRVFLGGRDRRRGYRSRHAGRRSHRGRSEVALHRPDPEGDGRSEIASRRWLPKRRTAQTAQERLAASPRR